MTETTSLQKTVDTVLAQMQNLTVTTDEQYIEAGEFLKKCRITVKAVQDFFSADLAAAQEKKKAAEAERKSVDNQIKAFTDRLDAAERTVKRIMGEYQMAQEKARREAEDARRREEEERRLTTAIETGHEEVLDKPVTVIKEEPVRVAGTSTVDVWEFEIVDKAKINPDYLIPDEKAIGALVRSMKDRAQAVLGPGVKITCRKDIRVRV